jgi:L-fucose mutarotase
MTITVRRGGLLRIANWGAEQVLKNIDPLLSPDLLMVLAEMGHADELAIVDANFPAASMGKRVVRVSASSTGTLEAVLTLLPLDDFVEVPATVLEVEGAPDEVPQIVREFQVTVDIAEGRSVKMGRIDRLAFYERTKSAFAVVATGETRLYGCILVKKGVIRPN